MSIDEQSSDEIEVDSARYNLDYQIELRRDNVKWEFRAGFDDDRLEVEIDFQRGRGAACAPAP